MSNIENFESDSQVKVKITLAETSKSRKQYRVKGYKSMRTARKLAILK
jgi:hypothetical protein